MKASADIIDYVRMFLTLTLISQIFLFHKKGISNLSSILFVNRYIEGMIDLKVRLLTISSTGIDEKEVPQIRLQGKWLEKLGFRSGKKIMIEEKQGQLVLKTVTIEE